MLRPINKDKLYRMTDWASWDCQNLIETLHELGLVLVEEKELEIFNKFCKFMEDDGR